MPDIPAISSCVRQHYNLQDVAFELFSPSDIYHPNEERIAAIVEGYCCYHMLTHIELERLVDAIRFRSLVYGACHFASTIVEHQQEDLQWWWLRYNAAGEIATLAKRYFLREEHTDVLPHV